MKCDFIKILPLLMLLHSQTHCSKKNILLQFSAKRLRVNRKHKYTYFLTYLLYFTYFTLLTYLFYLLNLLILLYLTYFLTSWSRVLLDKLTDSQLTKNFGAFYGNRRFITAFTSACHLSLS
jgi:hypothetical protein